MDIFHGVGIVGGIDGLVSEEVLAGPKRERVSEGEE